MEKEIFIKKLQHIKLVAHRLGFQMTQYPENSLEVLKEIFSNKEYLDSCYGFEFDICFTKDCIPVVIHDKYIDDISDSQGLIKNYTLEELKKLNFGFRKSEKKDNALFYKIVTLEEILTFFESNIQLLENKIIKIETKDYIFTSKNNFTAKNLKMLASILNKFPALSKNIIHLSFWPFNLLVLKNIQKKNKYELIKNDLLCDYGFVVFLSRFMPFLDNLSLRIKANYTVKVSKQNSKRVNKQIHSDLFWINFANALKEKNMRYAIYKYGSVGLYTLNNTGEIEEICQRIHEDYLNENLEKIIITTDNPFSLKRLK